MTDNSQKNMIDEALDLALFDLERRGLPRDEACIAMLIKLRNSVSDDILKVVELLSDDVEISNAINPNHVL